MNISDVISLLGILTSLGIGLSALFVSVKSLRQSAKLVEQSTMGKICIYQREVVLDESVRYLVIKNIGVSYATVTNFHCDFDLSKLKFLGHYPFENIVGASLAPGENLAFFIRNLNQLPKETVMNFEISYITCGRTVNDNITVHMPAAYDVVTRRLPSTVTSLKAISLIMQDLLEKWL